MSLASYEASRGLGRSSGGVGRVRKTDKAYAESTLLPVVDKFNMREALAKFPPVLRNPAGGYAPIREVSAVLRHDVVESNEASRGDQRQVHLKVGPNTGVRVVTIDKQHVDRSPIQRCL